MLLAVGFLNECIALFATIEVAKQDAPPRLLEGTFELAIQEVTGIYQDFQGGHTT